MGPRIRMQSPMLASHRDEDTTKVPYLPLTLTTPAYAKPDGCEQSQGFTATQVAVGDPIVAFRNKKHIHWLTPVILELRRLR